MRLLLAALLGMLVGCGGTSQASPTLQPTAPPTAAPPAAVPRPTRTTLQAQQPPDGWLTYQHDAQRSGRAAGSYDPATLHQLWETPPLDGLVYAQPLVQGGRVYVPTQNDTLYALDATSGDIVWQSHVGEPVARSSLPCGNVDPTGILSTPVIDPSSAVLYAVAFVQPPHHELYAFDLATGNVRFHQPIDPPGASPLPHQQRAALSVANGTLYVPYGGLFGDCGSYHGWVLAASANDGSTTAVYQVPTQREGAIWAPAGASIDSAGDLFVSTGNGDSTSQFDYANAVVRLSPDLQMHDWFATSDWAELSRRDADLGSIAPTLLEDQGLVFQSGKNGIGYLLKADHLGNIGGEVFQAPVCNGAYGGTAHAGDMVYVSCRNGLVALRVSNQQFEVAWRGPPFTASAPAITDAAVWTIDSGNARLYGLDPNSGQAVFQAQGAGGGNLPHFLAPAADGGRIFHSRGRSVVAFGGG
jgi:outer membrane protein assembly factor BamB